ncbi:hypothetical protein BDW22DRAFT_1431267 [Trametopsis cervina]|nr:hypothetical protein BDW22DRAFT_1431267 [Trametopsis cervina]
MVSFNVSLDDCSPLITYSQPWIDASLNDTLASNYSDASLHTATANGATATFSFNGTGVWLYGAHRPEYGVYAMTVDGQTVANGSASAVIPVFDQLLGGSSNLGMGEHTVTLTSVSGGPIDLDSLIFETQMDSQNQHVNQTVVDDSDPQISFSPATEWQVADHSYLANGSVHFTQTIGSQAALSFTGDAIAIYGGVSFDHGIYTVSIDGKAKTLNGGGYSEYHPKTLLYFAQGLGAGPHDLAITAGSQYLDVDSIVLYAATGGANATSAPPPTSTTSPTTMNNGGNGGTPATGPDAFHIDQSNASSHVKSIPPVVLAAIIGASIIGLVSIILIGFFLFQQINKHSKAKADLEAAAAADAESPTFIQDPKSDPDAGYFDKNAGQHLQRSNSRWTVKSFASRWSQSSYHQTIEDSPPPAVPPLPAGLANLAIPAPKQAGANGNYRSRDGSYQSTTSSDSGRGSVAPLRPKRPTGVDLDDLQHIEL